MSRNTENPAHDSSGFPRVSGDEPRMPRISRVPIPFSPRERG